MRFSALITLLCMIAYLVVIYVIKGEHWFELVFLVIGAMSVIFHKQLDDWWEERRSKNKLQ